eukprot:746569-Hanusia_phi.AAC.1
MERFSRVRIECSDSAYFEMTAESYSLLEKTFQLEKVLYLRKGRRDLGNIVRGHRSRMMRGSRSDFLRIGEHLRQTFSSFGKEHKARDFAL